jgi:hypothetical protein
MARKVRASVSNQVFVASVLQLKARLMQHSSAKSGLRGLLGVMTLSGLVSWGTMRRVRILPHDSCSTAGIVSLLARQGFWSKGRRWGEEERVFELGMRGGRFGTYAQGAGENG